ncbi:NAD(P)/FAD-dependent oxidoreductase [Cohnella rhizosphaerae]|uniref:FAD-dependent oxidoreductase n=1 Tax=Cohnella rhizosphaerae TaxID=1457232 RepID=A0A9X4L1V2_9BACL|nr:FAD-dependent oxidoreductase [Cohnella rhizosphaerae]MDG0814576.1 FAD-dependent oxidoreductase [Cohnella rhizosphaerae]
MSHIVILGGGYGGLTLVNELIEDKLPSDVRILLVDRMPFQGLKTEYYALAAGTSSDLDIRVEYPKHPQLEVIHGEVTDISPADRRISFAERDPLAYDYLVLALGCTDNYHGIEGAAEFACSIQSLAATRRTYQMLNNTAPYGQISIIGGGLSGVEVAAELRESRPDLNIRIVDRGPSVMSGFPGKLQSFVADWFREHNVEMLSHITTTSIGEGVIHTATGDIASDVTVWTAGIQPVEIIQRLAYAKDKAGRLVVNEYHELPDAPGVFVIGDCSSQPFSPSAQLAQAQGKQVAHVLSARVHGKGIHLPKIRLRGTLGSLGKKSGFGIMGHTPIMGRVPRMLKSGVLWKSRRHFG